MAPRPFRRDPWFIAFLAALGSLTAGLGFLGLALVQYADDPADNPAARAATPGATATGAPTGPLRVQGSIPAHVPADGLALADDAHPPDIVLSTPSQPGAGVVTRYWAWVASPHAGLDALTTTQLRLMLDGTGAPAGAGGLGASILVVAAAADIDQVKRLSGTATTVQDRATYGTIRAEMSDPRNPLLLALIPLDEVTPGMTAIAIDGTDIVRGRGDTATWPFADRLEVTPRTPRGQAEAPLIRSRFSASLPAVTTVVATGDILIARCTLTKVRALGDWAAPLRGPVGEYLAAADLALASLDASIQDIGLPYGCVETTNLTSPPQVIESLTLAGIDEATVATNHAADCGEGGCGTGMKALLRTLALLNGAGIKTVGGGSTLAEALAPAIFTVDGVTFGILGFDDIAAEELQATATEPGTAPLDDSYADERAALPREPAFYKPASMLGVTRLQETVRQLKTQVDVVIVQVQSGTEDTHDPSPRSIKALRAAADAGADLVVGNQAHYVQAVEPRADAFVAYALGNFIFDQRHTPEHQQGYLLEATFWAKKLVNVRLVPYQIRDQYQPVFAEGDLRAKILGDVWDASRRLAAATAP
ncbi:MAG: CapA family protein [Dehalococcoidia bacterium]